MLEKDDLRDGFFNQLVKKYKKNKNVYFLYADQGALSIRTLIDIDPNRCINVNISEQNMISMAAGLSMCGNIVYTYAISAFITVKAIEQIKIDLVSQKLNVKIIGSGTGFCYSTDGPTHHVLEDISLMSSYSGIKIYTPSNAKIADIISRRVFKERGISYIRLDKGIHDFNGLYSKINPNQDFHILKKSKKKICIIGYGITLKNIIENKKLQTIDATIIDLFCLSDDNSKLINFIKNFKKIIIIEEAYENCSLASILALKLIKFKNIQFLSIGIKNNQYFDYGSRSFQINKHMLNNKNINKIINFSKI